MNPSEAHYAAVKRVLWYIKGTLNAGIHYASGDFTMNAYADADWAGNPPERRSSTDFSSVFGFHSY